jgi:hypothetical protein
MDKKRYIFLLNVQPPRPPSLLVTRAMIAEHHESKSKEALAGARRALVKHRVGADIAVRIGEPANRPKPSSYSREGNIAGRS